MTKHFLEPPPPQLGTHLSNDYACIVHSCIIVTQVGAGPRVIVTSDRYGVFNFKGKEWLQYIKRLEHFFTQLHGFNYEDKKLLSYIGPKAYKMLAIGIWS